MDGWTWKSLIGASTWPAFPKPSKVFISPSFLTSTSALSCPRIRFAVVSRHQRIATRLGRDDWGLRPLGPRSGSSSGSGARVASYALRRILLPRKPRYDYRNGRLHHPVDRLERHSQP